jgi:hypothetical protein
MKTVLDQSTAIYKVLKAQSTIAYAISGGIYKTLRPADSVLEDIVVNTITLSDGSLQRGVSNVNIHVADIQQTIGGKQFYAPNEARLNTLTNLVAPLLKSYFSDDFSFKLANTSLVREPEINQHYVNLRINFIFEDLEAFN